MADIKLKNYSGTEQEYREVPKIWLEAAESTEETPVLLPFSYGESIEGVPIELDFSGGDQTVQAPEGMLVKSAVIKKPETLNPANIVKGVEIAGIVGNNEGGSAELDELLRYFKCHINKTAGEITLYGIYYDLLDADTGSCNVTIPDTINGFSVIISATA